MLPPAICRCRHTPSLTTNQPTKPNQTKPNQTDQSAYTVARTMFETDSLPKHMAEHVAEMDEVWVRVRWHVGM